MSNIAAKEIKDGCHKSTLFTTALFICVILAVILSITKPDLVDAAATGAGEVVPFTRWIGCRRSRNARFYKADVAYWFRWWSWCTASTYCSLTHHFCPHSHRHGHRRKSVEHTCHYDTGTGLCCSAVLKTQSKYRERWHKAFRRHFALNICEGPVSLLQLASSEPSRQSMMWSHCWLWL